MGGARRKKVKRNQFGELKSDRAAKFFRTVGYPPLPPPPPPLSHIPIVEPFPSPQSDHGEIIEIEEKENDDWFTQHVDMMLISRTYSEVLKSPPPHEWDGKLGTVVTIDNMLPGHCRKVIK